MSDRTAIEWTDATWNPIIGCSVVSPGCTNCYAMRLAGTRLRNHPTRQGLTIETKAGPVWNGKVRLNEDELRAPLRWKRPRNIFVCAHADLFAAQVSERWIDKAFATMVDAPQHTYQVLTKRAGEAKTYVDDFPARRRAWDCHAALDDAAWPLPNLHLGVSVEDQTRADLRIPVLLKTPAAKRWISAEPLLGPLDLRPWLSDLDWVVVGGESGPGSRPMHPDWVRQIRDDCAAAGVPFLFKQWGEWLEIDVARDVIGDDDPRLSDAQQRNGGKAQLSVLNEDIFVRVGKKAAGRLLDGVEHNGMPGEGGE